MAKTQDRLEIVLSKIGLKSFMRSLPLAYNTYDRSDFTNYVSTEYMNSSRKETDEAYRMFEVTLLHNKTGLRISYTSTESYDGETMTYKLNKVFIQTTSELMFDVIDVDFEKKIVMVKNNIIPFETIRKIGKT